MKNLCQSFEKVAQASNICHCESCYLWEGKEEREKRNLSCQSSLQMTLILPCAGEAGEVATPPLFLLLLSLLRFAQVALPAGKEWMEELHNLDDLLLLPLPPPPPPSPSSRISQAGRTLDKLKEIVEGEGSVGQSTFDSGTSAISGNFLYLAFLKFKHLFNFVLI